MKDEKTMEKQIDTPTNTPTKSQYTNCEIEEMAKAIHINCHKGLTEDEAKMIAKWCYQEIDRKASEVAEEIFAEIEEGIKAAVSALQFENNPIHRRVKHETYSRLMRFVKIVEQKYTESEKDDG